MIDKFCNWITEKIKGKIPDIDEEKEAVIGFGVFLIFRRITQNFSFIYIRIYITNWLVFHFDLPLTCTISHIYRWFSLKNTLGMHAK